MLKSQIADKFCFETVQTTRKTNMKSCILNFLFGMNKFSITCVVCSETD